MVRDLGVILDSELSLCPEWKTDLMGKISFSVAVSINWKVSKAVQNHCQLKPQSQLSIASLFRGLTTATAFWLAASLRARPNASCHEHHCTTYFRHWKVWQYPARLPWPSTLSAGFKAHPVQLVSAGVERLQRKQKPVGFAPPYLTDLCRPENVCKRSFGWINYDNCVHFTQPKRKIIYLTTTFHSPTANFIRHVVTWRCWWTRDQNTRS